VGVRDVPFDASSAGDDSEGAVGEGAREDVVAAGAAAFTRGEPVHVRDVPFEVAHLGEVL
jgi:hypothetical protein